MPRPTVAGGAQLTSIKEPDDYKRGLYNGARAWPRLCTLEGVNGMVEALLSQPTINAHQQGWLAGRMLITKLEGED